MLFVCQYLNFAQALFSVSLRAILTPKKKKLEVTKKEHYGMLCFFPKLVNIGRGVL